MKGKYHVNYFTLSLDKTKFLKLKSITLEIYVLKIYRSIKLKNDNIMQTQFTVETYVYEL